MHGIIWIAVFVIALANAYGPPPSENQILSNPGSSGCGPGGCRGSDTLSNGCGLERCGSAANLNNGCGPGGCGASSSVSNGCGPGGCGGNSQVFIQHTSSGCPGGNCGGHLATKPNKQSQGSQRPYWWEGSGNPFKGCLPGTPGCKVSLPSKAGGKCNLGDPGCGSSGGFNSQSSSISFSSGSPNIVQPIGCRPGSANCGSYSDQSASTSISSHSASNIPSHTDSFRGKPSIQSTSELFQSQPSHSSSQFPSHISSISSDSGTYDSHTSISGSTDNGLSSGLSLPLHSSVSSHDSGSFPISSSGTGSSSFPSSSGASGSYDSVSNNFHDINIGSPLPVSSSLGSFSSHGSSSFPTSGSSNLHSNGLAGSSFHGDSSSSSFPSPSTSGSSPSHGESGSYSSSSGSFSSHGSSSFPSSGTFDSQSSSSSFPSHSISGSSPSHGSSGFHFVNSGNSAGYETQPGTVHVSSFQSKPGSLQASNFQSNPSSSHASSFQSQPGSSFHSGSSSFPSSGHSPNSFQSGAYNHDNSGSGHKPVQELSVSPGVHPHDLRPITTGINVGGMTMMMMPMGMNLLGGTCSASSYCVQVETCNPYNGFIIRDVSQVPAARYDQPKVPLIECFVPAGGISNGVCCQEPHPIAGLGD